MPQRDTLHDLVKQAQIKSGWEITDDPYRIHYGERFLYVDLGIETPVLGSKDGQMVGAQREGRRIAEVQEWIPSQPIATS
jgi:hypothetical protein